MIKEIFTLQNAWRYDTDYLFDLRNRNILDVLINNLENKKILGLIGARQVGKSSLLYLLIEYLLNNGVDLSTIFYFNLDDLKLHELFTSIPDFIQFIGPGKKKKTILIDEVQRLENPGLFLKEVNDLRLNIKIIYSGSSQLEIKSKLTEYLGGRARQFEIHQLSQNEYLEHNSPITKKQALEDMLVYGAYPEIAFEKNKTEKKLLIKDIYQGYVEKDLVDFLKVDNITAFNNLLVLLANQIGNLLNTESLARALRISRKETEKYINILENTFIIKRVYPFHRNYKKEVIKTPKIYFLDAGIRNYTINNFNPLPLRNDIGALFENFYYTELLKNDFYARDKINYWRTTNQTEIDFIVQKENRTEAIEIKWNQESIPKSFKTIVKYYPQISPKVVTHKKFVK